MTIPKVLVVIPARGGSKGIPRKNLKKIAGQPLIYYSIKVALNCELVNKVVVSSDDKEILQVAKDLNAETILRPSEISTDVSSTEQALIHVVNHLDINQNYVSDYVMLLQPTSPYREIKDISGAINTIIETQADSLLSVVPNHSFLWRNSKDGPISVNYDFKNRLRRQDLDPEFKETGSIYITKTDVLLETKNRLNGKIALFVMDEKKGWEIDTLQDFEYLEFLLKKNNLQYEK